MSIYYEGEKMKNGTYKIMLILLILCIVIASGIIKFYGDNEEKTLKVKGNKAEIK